MTTRKRGKGWISHIPGFKRGPEPANLDMAPPMDISDR